MELEDGTVLPSYLQVGFDQDVSGAEGSLKETTLRVGEVVAAYAPNHPANKGESHNKQWVYVVNVSYRDGAGARSIVPYRCVVADLFGGLADHFRYTVRRTDAEKQQANFTNGSHVLVLCPSGDKSNALIVGGVRHSKEKVSDPNDIFCDFLFNGVNATINADGSFSLIVPGATKVDGTPGDRDSSNKGSKVTFAKNGDIAITDQNGETISISPGNKHISVTAGTQTSTIEERWKLQVPTVEVIATDVTVNASTVQTTADKVTVNADTVQVTANDVTVTSPQINLGDSNLAINPLDYVVLGSGIDTLTGLPFFALNDTSKVVKAKK